MAPRDEGEALTKPCLPCVGGWTCSRALFLMLGFRRARHRCAGTEPRRRYTGHGHGL